MHSSEVVSIILIAEATIIDGFFPKKTFRE